MVEVLGCFRVDSRTIGICRGGSPPVELSDLCQSKGKSDTDVQSVAYLYRQTCAYAGRVARKYVVDIYIYIAFIFGMVLETCDV
jgi:hypothetical protein